MNGKNDEKTDEKQQEAIRASDLTDTKDGGTVIIEAIFVRAESPITIRIVKPLHKSMSSMALSDLILVIASDLDEKLTEWEKTHKSLTKSSENSQVTGKKERNNPYPEGTPAFEGTQPKCPYCNDGTLLCVKHLVDTKAVGGYDFLAWSCRKWSSVLIRAGSR